MTLPRPVILLTLAVFCSLLVGCGTKYQPVTGEIVYTDGTPVKGLAGGTVAFQKVGSHMEGAQSEGTNPNGPIDADGKFTLGTMTTTDGAMEGDYTATIAPPLPSGDEQIPKVIADKYTKFDPSGKTYTVKKGKNHFKIEVEPFK